MALWPWCLSEAIRGCLQDREGLGVEVWILRHQGGRSSTSGASGATCDRGDQTGEGQEGACFCLETIGVKMGEEINLLKGLKIWNLTDIPLNIHFPGYKLCWHASLQHYEGTTQLKLMLDIWSSQQARPQTTMFSRSPPRSCIAKIVRPYSLCGGECAPKPRILRRRSRRKVQAWVLLKPRTLADALDIFTSLAIYIYILMNTYLCLCCCLSLTTL